MSVCKQYPVFLCVSFIKMKKCFQFLFVMLSVLGLSAQPVITPLQSNNNLNKPTGVPAKRNAPDTLQLPYMDDFTTTTVVPDPKFWLDAQAYINDHFPVSAPSYGVATLDNLDSKGRPYQSLNGLTHSHSDSLTSVPVNLKNYKIGLNTFDYSPGDSIYLSFFYQTQGLGDPLDGTDSLVLKFRDREGFWKTVWKTAGSAVKPFKQVLVPVLDTSYLYAAFQFRFINFGKTTGNMNQWHIDYVRMKSGRNYQDTVIADAAINAVPVGPLQWYESMPIDHYRANPAFNDAAFHRVRLRNNFTGGTNVQYKCEVRNTYNQLIKDYPLSSSARNVLPGDSSEDFTPLSFDTLSGKTPIVSLKYTIAPLANDFMPDNYNSTGNNNIYTKTVRFGNYFAYDDGSAEGGYGLDYGSLPAGPGYAAVKFRTFKPDTLRGISVFFNRSVSDVLFKSFSFIIWQSISEPPAPNADDDVILKKVDMSTVIYSDSINGFTTIVLDTSIALPQGDFYIGWQQNTPFMLNIGYDNNYRYAKTGGRNPNLFFNLNGYWEKVNGNISGAVMMRPIVGEPIKKEPQAPVRSITRNTKIFLYPNPAAPGAITGIAGLQEDVRIRIFSSSGILLFEGQTDNLVFTSPQLAAGTYFVEVTETDGRRHNLPWIIFE